MLSAGADPSLELYSKADLRESRLAQEIVLGGWLEAAELASAYRLASVVATPSVCFDSFPTINLEGMAPVRRRLPPVLAVLKKRSSTAKRDLWSTPITSTPWPTG